MVRHTVETLLAGAVPITTWATVASEPWYPTWLTLGPVTVGWESIPPACLAVAVLAVTAREWRDERPHVGQLALAGLAAVVFVSAAWAAATLTFGTPGLYVAGLFPMVTGNLLAVAVLLRRVVTRL